MTEPKLVLGTANLGTAYGRNNPKEMKISEATRLLIRAYDEGIRWLDVSANYHNFFNVYEWQANHDRPFNLICKIGKREDIKKMESLVGTKEYFILGHGLKAYEKYKAYLDGASLYSPDEIGQDMSVIEFPLNIFDMRWLEVIPPLWNNSTLIARSIFLQGEAFKDKYLAEISFNLAMSLPIEFVIVGADTPDQLSEIVHMPRYEVDYTKLAKGGEWLKKKLR